MSRTTTDPTDRHRTPLVAIVVAATAVAVIGVVLSIFGSGVAADGLLGIVGVLAFTWVGAERTVAGLAARLRDEVDVARLREDIVEVVVRSVEPTGAELWLRPGVTR